MPEGGLMNVLIHGLYHMKKNQLQVGVQLHTKRVILSLHISNTFLVMSC